jgi:hypothetical protein
MLVLKTVLLDAVANWLKDYVNQVVRQNLSPAAAREITEFWLKICFFFLIVHITGKAALCL